MFQERENFFSSISLVECHGNGILFGIARSLKVILGISNNRPSKTGSQKKLLNFWVVYAVV